MQQGDNRCSKLDDSTKTCRYCCGSCVKNGSIHSKQRYRCTQCRKCFVASYTYKAYEAGVGKKIGQLLKEGCGIRSIARLLNISAKTVLKRILQLSKSITKPFLVSGKEYEVDEVCTYLQKKSRQLWIVYALRRDTGQVTDYRVGSRTLSTLQHVTDTLLLSKAQKIHTDKLPYYKSLLPGYIHNTTRYGTNRIERYNLCLRTHLKRLNRRTICYSKSRQMLEACLRIYFWGDY